MFLATPINKFISNHGKILLKEMKDMKMGCLINCMKPMT